MERQPDVKPRLEVNDKRVLFNSLLAMSERLFYLNKFPMDQVDFALSMFAPDEEAAIRLLRERTKDTITTTSTFHWNVRAEHFILHMYPNESGPNYNHQMSVFPKVDNNYNGGNVELLDDNKYAPKVLKWVRKQLRLEDQLKRTAKVLKAIVHSCNTVGQYKRVSPELVTFLPEKYRLALADYTKTSPYPAITVEPAEIEAAISTLAFAALQPEHRSETDYTVRPKYGYGARHYTLDEFPRTHGYMKDDIRQLQL